MPERNAGDCEVLVNSREACLPSPRKSLGRTTEGRGQKRCGRESNNSRRPWHTRYLHEPFGSRCALPPVGHVPEQPGTTAHKPAPPPRFRIIVKPHLLPPEDGAILRLKASRKDNTGAGPPGRHCDAHGLAVQAQGRAGACLATRCREGCCGTWASPWERRGLLWQV